MMKRLVILNVESSQLAGFTNKGVKVYAKDVLTNEEVIIPIAKRPEVNQIALVTDRVLKTFGSPRNPESWDSVIQWGSEFKFTQFENTSDLNQDRLNLEAITIDSDKTFYKSDAVSITNDGIIFHVYDFSNFKINKLGRCSDFLAGENVSRCFPKEILDKLSFCKDSKYPAISVNLNTGEIFKSNITITDSYLFDEAGISSSDVMKWGKTFSKILCSHHQISFQHDVTRPLHSLAGVAMLSGQLKLLDKIIQNQNIEKTIDFISNGVKLFKIAIQNPSKELFVKWINVNPLIVQSESCSKYSCSKWSMSNNIFESSFIAPNKSSFLKIDSIS